MKVNPTKLPEILYLPVIKNKEGTIIGYGQAAEFELAVMYKDNIQRNDLLIGDTVELVAYYSTV